MLPPPRFTRKSVYAWVTLVSFHVLSEANASASEEKPILMCDKATVSSSTALGGSHVRKKRVGLVLLPPAKWGPELFAVPAYALRGRFRGCLVALFGAAERL
ncbi:unnamed protein product [Rangifer tarandus platyrhynchus]|uniref:Secreted protein n=1 Tax=Rangifer tarandus platyrhynchus TaxID=3082113 RepID=A0ABN8XIS9_RANTA|nr:unnamed protein product [Rangifer tarandus platyrhynchus]